MVSIYSIIINVYRMCIKNIDIRTDFCIYNILKKMLWDDVLIIESIIILSIIMYYLYNFFTMSISCKYSILLLIQHFINNILERVDIGLERIPGMKYIPGLERIPGMK